MKKIMKSILFLIMSILLVNSSYSQIRNEKKTKPRPVSTGINPIKLIKSSQKEKADFSYNIDDINLITGNEAFVSITITDIAVVGIVIISYDWDTDDYP